MDLQPTAKHLKVQAMISPHQGGWGPISCEPGSGIIVKFSMRLGA